MNCLVCNEPMRTDQRITFKTNSMSYYCDDCDLVFHVICSHQWHKENNLVLSTHGGLRIARDI